MASRKRPRILIYVLGAFCVCVVLLLCTPRGLVLQQQAQQLADVQGVTFRSDAIGVTASASLPADQRDLSAVPAQHKAIGRLNVSKEDSRSAPTTTTSMFASERGLPWEVSNEKITFQMSVIVDEGAHMARIPIMLTLFKFCFEEIFLLFDIPHGGCNYGPVRLTGGPRTVGKFLHSDKKRLILEEADRVLAQAASLHRIHCPTPVRTRAEIIDYESNRIRNLWRSSFDLNFEPPTAEQSKWPFAFMWKNTMAYVLAVQDASNEFVLHVDDDIGIISDKNEGIGEFVKTSLKEFASTTNLVISQLAWCNQVETRGQVLFKSDGEIRLYKGKDFDSKHENFVTVQLYMTKKSQFAKLYPLQYWRHFTESSIMVSLRVMAALAIMVEMPGFCKAQLAHSVEGTPLSAKEKAQADILARSFSSDAIYEPFQINEPHGRCKFR